MLDRPPGADGFDFLYGSWSVLHRKLRNRLVGSSEWYEFPGTLSVRSILGGLGNIDENVLVDPQGAYLATSLRLFDGATKSWTIYWMDGRRNGIDPPVSGCFAGRKGSFYGEDDWLGRPIRVLFTYEDLDPTHARWSQSFSPNGGQSWEVNWVMEFTRTGLAEAEDQI